MAVVNTELEPTFSVKVFLDGDDDPATGTENVAYALGVALAQMWRDGYCVNYEVTRTAS